MTREELESMRRRGLSWQQQDALIDMALLLLDTVERKARGELSQNEARDVLAKVTAI